MSTTNVIVGQKGNEKAAVALSSLIHALYELDSYAIVRFVKKKNDAPMVLVLAASIDADFECLIDVQVCLYSQPPKKIIGGGDKI
jgi:ATP-dependent DNA helicase 2 subunit 2